MDVRDVERNMDKWMQDVTHIMELTHRRVADEFVENARNNVTQSIYNRAVERKPNDLTGNLRSSIGYTLLTPDGQLQGGFTGEGNKGKQEGKQLSMSLASTANGDFNLSLVAGMEYAAAVESRGYDVITQAVKDAEKTLNREVQKNLKQLISRL